MTTSSRILTDYLTKGATFKGKRSNDRGNTIYDYFLFSGDRYRFDFKYCLPEHGWKQYDTSQDAEYFGVWVHVGDRVTMTYCEGDISLVWCDTVELLQAELADMEKCYGPAPWAAVTIDHDGTRTEYYDERPTA